jgi:pSer/pThr/pTyr-binding forkhead associated (FHA) protein/Mg-chelatase subunit ChlD
MEKRTLMSLSFTRFFCLGLILVMLPPYAATTAAEGQATDPALEAIQALEKTAAPKNTTVPAAAPKPENAAAPGASEVPAIPVDTESTASPTPDQETSVAKDIVLVLDNSGSMKKNDPKFLASQAVTEFVGNLDSATHLAVIIFDADVRIAMPLTEINDSTREGILQSLKEINYKGLYTNSPAAIERAIYELKNNGRPDAKKAIIFMTDGIVDTGKAERDQEKVKWLKDELAGSAADADIAIYGIAFTEEADFQLIQSLAQKTHGEYYRALKPEDLKGVYDNLQVLINKVAKPVPAIAAPTPVESAPAKPAPPPAPVIIEMPAQPQPESKSDWLMLAALAALIIAVIFLVLMVMRTNRGKAVDDISAPEAFLNDIHGYTAQASHKLGNMPTILGRTAGTDTDHMNYIVIPQTTIGRRHALIEYKDYAYWIMDQGSINGTFVNDEMITGETRLKHGDKVRLHKYEFEFVMPEMVDAGMTVVSHTIMGKNSAAQAGAKTVARADTSDARESSNLPEPDFDLSDMATSENPVAADRVDTVMRGPASGEGTEDAGDDETIVMDTDGSDASVTDATLRPDTNDDDDSTVDHFHDNNKTS